MSRANRRTGETVRSTRLVRWWSKLPVRVLRARVSRAYDRASLAWDAGRKDWWSAWASLAAKMDQALVQRTWGQ